MSTQQNPGAGASTNGPTESPELALSLDQQSLHPMIAADTSIVPWIGAWIGSFAWHFVVATAIALALNINKSDDPYAQMPDRFVKMVKEIKPPPPPPPPPPPLRPISLKPVEKVQKVEVQKQVKAKVIKQLAARVERPKPQAQLRTVSLLTDIDTLPVDNNGFLGAGMPGGESMDLDGGEIVGAGSAGFKQPGVLRQVKPEFPQMAKTAGIKEAEVEVLLTIAVDGTVKDVRFLKGLPVYQDAILAAIRQWLFQPATQDGKPVEVTFTQRFVFQLVD